MIYLIGGPPKCGKTTLAKKLAKTLKIPWVSTDTLECVIRPYIDVKDFSEKFPTIDQRSNNNDEKYSKYSTNEIIEAYKKQAKTSYQAIDMFTVCEIVYGNNYIIEGYHIEPELIVELNSKYPDKIRSIFIVKSDKEKFIADISKSSTPDDWIIKRTYEEETYKKIANMICEYGNIFEKEVKKYDLKILNMEDNFDDKINEAIDYLTNK